MAIRTIEARLERMSVNDENEHANGVHVKPKVLQQVDLHYQSSLMNPKEFSVYNIAAFRASTNYPADVQSQSLKPPEVCPTEQQ